MHKPLKVVYITPDLYMEGGGVKTFLKTLVYCLDRQQIDTIIVTNHATDADSKDFEALGASVYCRVKNIQSLSEQGNVMEITQWIIEMLNILRPDIVHTQLFWGDTLGRIAAARVGIPVIVSTEQNINLNEDEKHRKIKQRLANLTDSVVCVSEAVRSYSRDIDKIPAHLLRVISNSILLQDYGFNYLDNIEQHEEFVYVGRLEPQKNPVLLIEAFAAIACNRPNCNLSIIGDGRLIEQCLDKVRTLGLSGQVKFLGYKHNPWIYAPPGSIFVLSSDFEGLPFAVLEAMAVGHLCVLPDVASIPEMAEAGSEAVLYESGHQDKLIASMMFALEMTQEQRYRMIKAARKKVEKDFDAYRMADNYLNLYLSLYSRKGRGNEIV